MTITQAQAESLYSQVLEMQAAMIQRRQLATSAVHQVEDDSYFTVVGTTWIHCSCGDWSEHAEERAALEYALHVSNTLGLKVRLGRAA